MNTDEMELYTGENYYRKTKRLDLPELSLNGQRGVFKKGESLRKKGGEGWQSEEIQGEVSGVFLRIRKILKDYKSEMWTPEFNSNTDEINLFQGFGKGRVILDSGKASEIRTKYKSLRTHQIVYFLMNNNEIVRLIVKGASFGSEKKSDKTVSFYDYLSSFIGDEHVWQYYTKLEPVKEVSTLGTYYAIHFERGNKLNDEELEIVKNESKKIHESIVSLDADVKKQNENREPLPKEKDETIDTEQKEPTEIKDIDDLPF